MTNELVKTKFDIATFEAFDSNGNALLRGGFSVAYEDKFASGGNNVCVNLPKNCSCTINDGCNTVVGCACNNPDDPV